jgi:hypothetical protein
MQQQQQQHEPSEDDAVEGALRHWFQHMGTEFVTPTIRFNRPQLNHNIDLAKLWLAAARLGGHALVIT